MRGYIWGVVEYTDSLDGIGPDGLRGGFFEGWSNAPSPETHLRLLENSDAFVLAVGEPGAVVGFVTAITDGILCAHVPLLEVLPAYRGRGIGRELVRRVLSEFDDLYMLDLLCDPELQPFYASLGMSPATGMMVRGYTNQAGRESPGTIY